MKYENCSIKKAMNMIVQKQMYLPEFQRSFVWHEEQIENLFDSIIMGYPIGTLLFWKTTKKAITENNLVLYEFIKDYHQRDCADNKKAPEKLVTDYDNYYLVLDGQQRLSALYIALQGSIAYKIKKKWWNTDEAFPKKKLYFNLDSVSEQKQDEDGNVKRFKFYSDKEVPTSENFWFKVCNIIDFDTEFDVFQYIYTYGLNEIQGKNILKLFKIFNASGDEAILNFYSIEESNYDDVLNIFVRVNASGTYLSKTDLLFSTIVSGWTDGREKIENLIRELNNKGGKFNFNKDFIMRTCLVLTGAAVNLKIDSFKKETVANIREEFDNIKTALIKTVKMLVAAAILAVITIIWSIWFPIIKSLWTSTFVLAAASYSLVMFAIFYYLIDVKGWRKGVLFFQVIGMNSITIYMAIRFISFDLISKFFLGGLAGLFPENVGKLVLLAGTFVAEWYFLYFLYKHKVFLKV